MRLLLGLITQVIQLSIVMIILSMNFLISLLPDNLFQILNYLKKFI